MSGKVNLRELTERIRAIEQRRDAAAHQFIDRQEVVRLSTGWNEVDAALNGGLPAGGLHEWFGVERIDSAASERAGKQWSPALSLLTHLAWQAVDRLTEKPWIVWVGRRCHPYPRILIRKGGADRRLLSQSLFVTPSDAAARLWAIDVAVHSPVVGVVIADSSGFDRAATQRLQLTAHNHGTLILAACPPRQRDVLSAAQTRWMVTAIAPSARSRKGIRPQWSVELLRCKGVRPNDAKRTWLMEWNHAEGAINLSAGLADLAGKAQTPIRTNKPAQLRRHTA